MPTEWRKPAVVFFIRCVDRSSRDVYGRRSRQDRRQPVGAVHRPLGGEWSRRANRPSDSSPASVEESAAAEQQHHEDDDEECGRVHLLSCVLGERSPASSRPPNARDERRRFDALAVRITSTLCRLPAVQAGVCSLLNKH